MRIDRRARCSTGREGTASRPARPEAERRGRGTSRSTILRPATRGGTGSACASSTTSWIGPTTSATRLPSRFGVGPVALRPSLSAGLPCRVVASERSSLHTKSHCGKREPTDSRGPTRVLRTHRARPRRRGRSFRFEGGGSRTGKTLPPVAASPQGPPRPSSTKSSVGTSSAAAGSARGEWIVCMRKCKASGNAFRNRFALPGSFSNDATKRPR